MSNRALFFDCFSGISGDMTVGALLDLGGDGEALRREIAKVEIEERVELSWQKVDRLGITATKFDIGLQAGKGPEAAHPRTHREIIELIETSGLQEPVKRRAIAIFAKIAMAEAKIHGVAESDVHFHEVGAVDSIIDIVAVSILLESLAPDLVVSSPVTLGSGLVKTMHGLYPVPAPATLEILRGAPVRAGEGAGELATPTGAGILATMVNRWGRLPEIQIEGIGYGAGTKVSDTQPNVLRLVFGTLAEEAPGRPVTHGHTHDHSHEPRHEPRHSHPHGESHRHDHEKPHSEGKGHGAPPAEGPDRRPAAGHDHGE